jgi:hypothetical protein
MTLIITIPESTSLGDNVFTFELAPQQLRQLGDPKTSEGERSIVIISNFDYSANKAELTFEMNEIRPINIGTTNKVVAIGANNVIPAHKDERVSTKPNFGKGDEEFLHLCKKELSSEMAMASKLLLSEVRDRYAGDLKRGQTKNFSETPDNFWYVIVQNRIDQLSITVRGSVDHFSGISSLETKDDRGNTLFKVKSASDVPEAIKLIFHAIKKAT